MKSGVGFKSNHEDRLKNSNRHMEIAKSRTRGRKQVLFAFPYLDGFTYTVKG
jgi:hypothetical protein